MQLALLSSLLPGSLFGFTERFMDFLNTLYRNGIMRTLGTLRANLSTNGQSTERAPVDLSAERCTLQELSIAWETAFTKFSEAFQYRPRKEGQTHP